MSCLCNFRLNLAVKRSPTAITIFRSLFRLQSLSPSLSIKHFSKSPLQYHSLGLTMSGSDVSNGSDGKKYCIGTHNGVFHADEALACFMLKRLPEYHNATIIRSRDPDVYNKCDVVVDVGGVYDATMYRFDHHQRSFAHTMATLQPGKPWTIKLSSAGLIYCHFGRRLIGQVLAMDVKENGKTIELIYDKVYDTFIAEMDAIDNGVSQSDKPLVYQINTGLSSRVKRLNPRWNDQDKSTDALFLEAVKLTGEELLEKIKFYSDVWLPARTIVESAINKRHQVDSSGQIIKFDTSGCPWQDHLFQMEKELQLESSIKFALYEDDNGQWRVQAVPLSNGSFISRLPLPEAWRGLNTQVLSKVTGIDGCVFCHHSGFIAGNITFDGVLQMALHALKDAQITADEKGTTNSLIISAENTSLEASVPQNGHC